jgi:hypothetical protein
VPGSAFNISDPASFGVISSTYYPPRHIQIAAKLEF